MDAADTRKKNATIKVAYMARVEGEASLEGVLLDGECTDHLCQLFFLSTIPW